MPARPTLLEELAARAGGISQAEVEQFHRLVTVWQMVADLSFADLLLLAPLKDDPDQNLLVLAQIRPLTAQTLYPDDHVGTALLAEYAPSALRAFKTGKIQKGKIDTRGVHTACIPFRVGDRVPAVVLREGMPFGGREVSGLEEAYSTCAEALFRMIGDGAFPYERMEAWEPPRVGEGMMVVASTGQITLASPNAVAANRRLGVFRQLVGMHAEVSDDGIGIPGDFSWDDSGLGLQIVHRLVTDELGGKIELHRNGGTRVEIDVPLPGYPQR